MIFQNEITLGGRVAKVVRSVERKLARIHVEVPSGDEDNEKEAGKTVVIPVDVVGDQFPMTEVIKEGDFFACKAQLINQKLQPDGKDQKFTIRWPQALPSRPLVIIPDGGKYAKAAFNEVCFQGKCQRITDLKESSGGKKMCFVTVTYFPKLEKSASEDEKKAATVYADAAFFGGTAEKYIKPYLKEKDVILLTGVLTMYEENWTVKGKKIASVRINARDAKFVTPVERDGSGKRNNDKPNYDAYKETGKDDDLQF